MQLNTIFQDWLNRRKITESIIADFSIAGAIHDFLGECISIPIHDIDGNFLFNKYRRNPLDDAKPKYVYDKGGSINLYGSFKAKDKPRVLITEGEMDCLVAWSANIPAVTSTGGSMSFQEEWADFFIDKEVILCFDNDQAGGEGMVRALRIVPHAKILFLPDRPGVKDISDYVASGGDLYSLMDTAKKLNTIEEVRADRSNRLSTWLSTHYHDAFITRYERENQPKREFKTNSNDKITSAKEYPIDNLLTFKANKIKCLWHSEKTESLHYYPKTNSCYCFGQCGRSFDSIDVYRKLHNCTFKEAVDKLSNTI